MQENINNLPNDEISLRELILKLKEWGYYLLSRKAQILAVAAFFAIVGFVFAWISKPKYQAEITFVLEEDKSGSSSSSLASLASQFGLSGVGGGANGLFSGENIMYLMKSRSLIQKTLLSPIPFGTKQELLVERFIRVNNLREKMPVLDSISFHVSPDRFDKRHNRVLETFWHMIATKALKVEKADKKLGIISVKFESKDELFSKYFVEGLLNNVSAFYVSTKTKKYIATLKLLQAKADSVRRVLNNNIAGIASSTDANPNAVFVSAKVPNQRRQIDVQILTSTYSEVIKNIEATKFLLQKETPLIQVVDAPILPLDRQERGKMKFLLIGAFLGAFLSMFYLIIKKILSDTLAE